MNKQNVFLAFGAVAAVACSTPPRSSFDGGMVIPQYEASDPTTCPSTITEACKTQACPLSLAEARGAFCGGGNVNVNEQHCGAYTLVGRGGFDTGDYYFYDTAGVLVGIGAFDNANLACIAAAPGFGLPLDPSHTGLACDGIPTALCRDAAVGD